MKKEKSHLKFNFWKFLLLSFLLYSITANGAPTPLTAPTTGPASGINLTSATANWSALPNASGGYIVNVYKSGTLIKTLNVIGQATTSVTVSGLIANNTYTYKIIAVGDQLNYSNSLESSASTFTTLDHISYCELPLYNTDFSDWTARPYSGSSGDVLIASGGGAGFTVPADATIDPTTGKLWIEGSTSARWLTTKTFNLLPGGTGVVIELDVELNNYSSNDVFQILAPTAASQVAVLKFDYISGAVNYSNLIAGSTFLGSGSTLDQSKIGVWFPGQYVFLPKNCVGRATIAFFIPGITGNQAFRIFELRKQMPLHGIRICNSVGTQKLVVSTDYLKCDDDAIGLSIIGTKGSSTPVSKTLNIKAWNITAPITMSIMGADSGSFSLPVKTITQANALAGQLVSVEFIPSVVAGVHNAQLKLSSIGASDYCVNLTGLTQTGFTPEIIADTATIPFWTSLIATTTNTIKIAGINLTGNISLSLSGTSANQFSISTNSIPQSNGIANENITIKYLGDINVKTQTANLVITSPGAATKTIPLMGVTSELKPNLRNLNFIISPAGSGYVKTNPQGTRFLHGSKIEVSAIPESGYRLERWGDGKASNHTTRTITLTDLTQGTITVYFASSTQNPPAVQSPSFVAYVPIGITDTAFTVSWTTVPDATGYLVTLYDKFGGDFINTFPVSSGSTNSILITGLTPGKFYSYKVETTGGITPAKRTSIVGPYQTTGGVSTYNCGQP